MAGSSTERSVKSKQSALVVVGSLLEKAANVGGLCRTCEIFGVTKLVWKSMFLRATPGSNTLGAGYREQQRTGEQRSDGA
jgi:hypothetical protein